MSATAPKRVGVFLSRLTAFHLSPPCDAELLEQCRVAWRECVTEVVADRVAPVMYSHGRLMLQADSSLWFHKLSQQRLTLIRRLRVHSPFRDLTDLDIRVVPRGHNPPGRVRSVIRPSANARLAIAQTAQDVADPDLRAALCRLAACPGSATKTSQ